MLKHNIIFDLSRILGLLPYDRRGKFSRRLAIHSTFIITIQLAVHFCAWFIYLNEMRNLHSSLMEMSVNTFVLLFWLLGPLIHFVVALKRKKEFSFLKNLSPLPDNETSLFDLFILIFGIFTSISATVDNSSKSIASLTAVVILKSFDCILQLLVLLQFLSIVKLLGRNFHSARSRLNVRKHEWLITLAHSINSLYGLQLFIYVVSTIANSTVAAYTLVKTVKFVEMTHFRLGSVAWISLFEVFQMSVLLYLCYCCSSIRWEAEEFNQDLFQLMESNVRLLNNDNLQLYLTMEQSVQFTACGFFKLGFPLVTSIIAVATTCLVCMLQFQPMSEV